MGALGAWVRRAIREAEKVRIVFNIPDWEEEVWRRRFRWAGHMSRRSDGRWAKVLLDWSITGMRRKGRPSTRWCDSLRQFFKGTCPFAVGEAGWLAKAQNREEWKGLEEDYVKYWLQR